MGAAGKLLETARRPPSAEDSGKGGISLITPHESAVLLSNKAHERTNTRSFFSPNFTSSNLTWLESLIYNTEHRLYTQMSLLTKQHNIHNNIINHTNRIARNQQGLWLVYVRCSSTVLSGRSAPASPPRAMQGKSCVIEPGKRNKKKKTWKHFGAPLEGFQ